MYSCVSESSPSSGFSTTEPVAPIHSFSPGTLPHGEWSANWRWWIQLCKFTTQPRQVSMARGAGASMAERIDAARQRLLESRVVNQARGLRVDFAECSMLPPGESGKPCQAWPQPSPPNLSNHGAIRGSVFRTLHNPNLYIGVGFGRSTVLSKKAGRTAR